MSTLFIPISTTHIFVNTKNKKSFYLNAQDGSWEIYNKGLEVWEKVPSLELNVIPINTYLENEMSNEFSDIEDTDVSITSVTNKEENNIKTEFINAPITPSDYDLIYDIFDKYSKEVPLGFMVGVNNYSVYFDHEQNTWKYTSSKNTEYLTVYTTSLAVVKQVTEDLNTSLTTHLTILRS